MTQQNNNKGNFISIDPGIRTFLTCLSENEVIKICNSKNKLYKKIKQLRNCRKIKSYKWKRYKMRRYEKKIKHMVDDMHWKIIGVMITHIIISRDNYFQLIPLQ